jgi:phage shock protein E
MAHVKILLGVIGSILLVFGCARERVTLEKNLSSRELSDMLAATPDGLTLVDVRTPDEYASGHIPGAVNIPVDQIADNPPAADKQALIVVYCRSGSRSRAARNALLEKGYTDVVNFGGVGNWTGTLKEGPDP